MSESVGHQALLILDGAIVMCFRTLTMTHNGEQLDATDSRSGGYRVLSMGGPGERSIDFQAEGIAKSAFLDQRILGDRVSYFENCALVWANGAVLDFDAAISAYSKGATYNELTTFSVTLQSSGPRGAWSYTPAPALQNPILVGAAAAPPTSGPLGAPLASGMYYYDTSLRVVGIYDGSQWVDVNGDPLYPAGPDHVLIYAPGSLGSFGLVLDGGDLTNPRSLGAGDSSFCFALSVGGTTMVSSPQEDPIGAFNLATGEPIELSPLPWSSTASAISLDGSRAAYTWPIVGAFDDGVTLRVYNMADETFVDHTELNDPPIEFQAMAFSPDGLSLVAVGVSGSLGVRRVYDVTTGDYQTILTETTGVYERCAYSPDGSQIFVARAGDNTPIDVLTADTLTPVSTGITWEAGHGTCYGIAVSDNLLAVGIGAPPFMRVFNRSDFSEVVFEEVLTSPPGLGMAFSPNGDILYVAEFSSLRLHAFNTTTGDRQAWVDNSVIESPGTRNCIATYGGPLSE